LLEIANLEVVYHGVVRVLHGVSLTVPKGHIVALLGPNGAGKTTLLRAITGLLSIHEGAITKGQVKLNDAALPRASEKRVASGIAQVMEGRRIFVDLTVEENLKAGSWVQGNSAPPLDEFYDRFPRLGEMRHRTAGYLSGGEQQQLAIARALMTKPKYLLLDEPSLGLAPKLVVQIGNLIREIRDSGVSILLVEQNAGLALDLADHGYILENGRVVLDGSGETLRNDADIQQFYLGTSDAGRHDYRKVKRYQKRKRWLS